MAATGVQSRRWILLLLCADIADAGGNRSKLLLRVLLLVTAKVSSQTVYYRLAINISGWSTANGKICMVSPRIKA